MFFGFRIQPLLPRRLVSNNVCRWSKATAIETPIAGVRFIAEISYTTGETFSMAEEWRLNLQP
jgi:hypothetical protein